MNKETILLPEDYEEPACLLCMKDPFAKPSKDIPKGRIPVDRIINKIDASFEKGNIEDALRVLEYWHGEAKELGDKEGQLSIVSELVGAYRKTGNREKALDAVREATSLMAALGNDMTISGATVLLNCATALKAFDMASEAMPLYEKTLDIYNKHLQGEDSRFGGLYNNMALALVDLGRYEEAYALYEKAIEVMRGVEHGEAEVAITYVNMVHLYETWGKSDRIGECLDKAYAFLMTEDLPRNGHYAYVLECCSPSFALFGREDEAVEFMKTAGEIYARA